MTAGTAVIMWLGELITDRGVGNGMSMLIFTRSSPSIPGRAVEHQPGHARRSTLRRCVLVVGRRHHRRASSSWSRPQRRIPVQYAKRMVGRKMFGGTRPTSRSRSTRPASSRSSSPVIAARTIPALAVAVRTTSASLVRLDPDATWSGATTPDLHAQLYFLLIVFFTYFYVAITFNPVEVADNMKKYGGFIPGIRAGRPTAEYLGYVLVPASPFPGSVYLGIVALMPLIALGLLERQPELPLRRHQHPDRGRRRSRHGASRSRASCSSGNYEGFLRVVRARPRRGPRCGQGDAGPVHRVALRRSRRSPTGDIFRANVSHGPPLGRRGQGATWTAATSCPTRSPSGWSATGWPDDDAGNGFLLDGFPRTCRRPRRSEDALWPGTPRLDVVLELVVDDDEVVRRLSGRRTCRRCGRVWHVGVRPAVPAGHLRRSAAASCSSVTTTARRRSGTGSRCTSSRPRR